MKQLKYDARARFCGNVEWLCSCCGTFNKHRLDYTSRQFECRGRNCSRRFHVGLKLWLHTRQGSGGRPRVYDVFPVVEVSEWHRRSVGAKNRCGS
jgi:hypothetical protein